MAGTGLLCKMEEGSFRIAPSPMMLTLPTPAASPCGECGVCSRTGEAPRLSAKKDGPREEGKKEGAKRVHG